MKDKKLKNKTEKSKTRMSYEKLQQKHKEVEDTYKRALSDYQNTIKRMEEAKTQSVRYANEVLIKKLLDILEALEKSGEYIKDEGLDKIIEKFVHLLKSEGLEEINPLGEEFNPNFHEAIESVDGEENKIVKVHRKGYKFFDKVVRPALVSVGNAKAGDV